MKTRPSLLFLCQTLPFPPDGGVHIRTYNVLRQLAKHFDITLLCFYRWKGGAIQSHVEANVDALRQIVEVEAFPIPQEHSAGRLVGDHLRSLFTGRSYVHYVYASSEFSRRLDEVLRTTSFDLVHIDSLDLAAYLPRLMHLPVTCVHHNVESQLLRRRAGLEHGLARRAYVSLQARLLERDERRWCGKLALNVAVSPEDRAMLERIAPEGRYTVAPNGVDLDTFRPGEAPGEKGVVFVGGTTWFPNKDGLQFFLADILPHLRKAEPTAKIEWVGRCSEGEKQTAWSEHRVEMTGYVPDIRPYVHAAGCFIVPLRVGGGTRLKVLDAWAMGKAVVSTSVGCEGLHARDGHNILIRDEPEEFARAVHEILEDPDLRHRLGAAARRTAEEHYGWDAIGAELAKEYLDIVARTGTDERRRQPAAIS